MPASTAIAPGPTMSDALCRLAIATYCELRSFDWCGDPDTGFGQAYVAGLRSIEARADADPWLVPAEVVGVVEELLVTSRAIDEDELADWLDRFPRRFLATIDRRGSRSGEAGRGRRWVDRAVRRSTT